MSDETPAFGPELRRVRLAAGLSLATLSARVHYSKGYLSKVENGSKAAGRELAALCDAALGTEGRLAGTVGAVVREPAAPSGRESPGPTGRALGAAAADGTTLDLFQSMFAEQRLLGRAVSPTLVLPVVTAQTRLTLAMAAAARDGERRALLVLAARYAEYTGWMAQEAGDEVAAIAWTAEAGRAAAAGGDPELARYALVRLAEIYLYRGDAAGVIEHAVDAQRDGGDDRVTGLALEREAQGHALAHERGRSDRAADRAQEVFAAAGTVPDAAGLGPLSAPNRHALVTGWCLYDLGRPEAAAELLDREVPLVPESARREVARFGTRRAMAHALAGDPDTAAALAMELLPVATQVDSATVRVDLQRLGKVLGRWEHRPEIARARTEIADALLPY
jgi:transcriptional regulator with XRE-family HTH domain